MTNEQIVSTLASCVSPSSIAKVSFRNRGYEEFFFPLKVSNRLFLAITERDFLLDGFTVRRILDIEQVEPLRGTYLKIHRAEGTLGMLSVPPINIASWRSVFSSLSTSGEIVIVECEEGVVGESFKIGRILAVGEQGVRFRAFDGSGTWEERPTVIPYPYVTAVTFGSRYITTYAKYVRPYPELSIKATK